MDQLEKSGLDIIFPQVVIQKLQITTDFVGDFFDDLGRGISIAFK
jgi:hypothetical protein